jgi:hypothetical protein
MIMHINLNCLPSSGLVLTFNISDLKPYLGEEDTLESTMTLIQEGEDDENITHLDAHNTSPLDIQGPITRAHARQLNLKVSSFLSTSTYDFENRLLPNDYIMIRNQGEDQEMHGEGFGDVEVQQRSASQVGDPIQVDFDSTTESRSSLP